jgi:hypothetical protein
LEQQLSEEKQTIEIYKLREKNYLEDLAICEMESKEKLHEILCMMEEGFVKREEQIVKLQNRLNEKKEAMIGQYQ